MNVQPIEILLVEDSIADVTLIRECLHESELEIVLQVVMDGVQAIDYLHKRGEYVKMRLPDIILLDLNLPKKDGREVLIDIKNDENLKVIPVLVFTTSNAMDDILTTYRLGANGYITKPVELEEFSKVIRAIEEFWFSVAELPRET